MPDCIILYISCFSFYFHKEKDAGNYLKTKRRGIEKQNEIFSGLRVLDMPEDDHAVPRWSRCCAYSPLHLNFDHPFPLDLFQISFVTKNLHIALIAIFFAQKYIVQRLKTHNLNLSGPVLRP